MSEVCIFYDNPANSKEDVPPRWSLRLLQQSKDEKVPIRTYRNGEPARQWLTGDTATRIGNVCKECNNGWMCRLEEEVIPILTPMIFGTAVTLTTTQQERITTWLTKSAMVFDGMKRDDMFYDSLDRIHFKKTVFPLQETSVWLGHYKGEGRSFSSHRSSRTKFKSGDSIKTHVLMMSIGEVVLQITCAKRVEYHEISPAIMLQTYGPSLDDALVQIWPMNLRDVFWPPSLKFDDSKTMNLKLLAERFEERATSYKN